MQIQNIKSQVVIHESHSKYINPVSEDLVAVCKNPGEEELEKFLQSLEKKSKARLNLNSEIYCAQQLAISFKGSYVAQKP